MAKEIPLTRGKVAIVDDDWFEILYPIKWYCTKDGYAKFDFRYRNESGTACRSSENMHRIIIDAPKHLHVDHINGNKLDNRRANLRLCNHSQNQQNRKNNVIGSSQFKGVSFQHARKKWKASITHLGRYRFLGHFESEVDAAKAYNLAAIDIFGSFAKLNIIEQALQQKGGEDGRNAESTSRKVV